MCKSDHCISERDYGSTCAHVKYGEPINIGCGRDAANGEGSTQAQWLHL